ncbi:MAG: hypothetical protein AB7S26_40195 [Sandaracinaceae bacterium]
MPRLNVCVYAPAPIGVGEEIEVLLMVVQGISAVAVRDLRTGILYGGGGIFSGATDDDEIEGHRSDFRKSQPAEQARVDVVYRGRVAECVVANVNQYEGAAACTSFVVDVPPPPAAPYRT